LWSGNLNVWKKGRIMKNFGPAIYFDWSTKGAAGKKRHNCWRADITVNGIRLRKRSDNKRHLERWLRDIKEGSF
jgi:hypothetical protein